MEVELLVLFFLVVQSKDSQFLFAWPQALVSLACTRAKKTIKKSDSCNSKPAVTRLLIRFHAPDFYVYQVDTCREMFSCKNRIETVFQCIRSFREML